MASDDSSHSVEGTGENTTRSQSAASPPTAVDETSLYYILRNRNVSIVAVVENWIERYRANNETAVLQLMHLIINACGCRDKISPEIVSMSPVLIVEKMTEEFAKGSGNYPLQEEQFLLTFCEFVQTLVRLCQCSIICDGFFLDRIMSLLIALSMAGESAFRYTATLAVMKLGTALLDMSIVLECEVERLRAQEEETSELQENMAKINNAFGVFVYKFAFSLRYRDPLPDIRKITVIELGIWMYKFPHFVDAIFLQYISSALADKDGSVREACLQALLLIYYHEECWEELELFSIKHKDHIILMTLDENSDVAVAAVKLLGGIFIIHYHIVSDADYRHIFRLVYSSRRPVARAAAEFMNSAIFPLYSEDAPQQYTPLIRILVEFFIEAELPAHDAYLVDAFIESHPMMKDWECMTDLLLERAGGAEEPLDDNQKASLMALMFCCIKQAATGDPPVGRSDNRNEACRTSGELSKVCEDKDCLTAHFITTLPLLLDKYSTDSEMLLKLLEIPQYFNRNVYNTSRQENNLVAVLDRIIEIFSVHTEDEVLETCAVTLEFLCAEKGIASQCATAIDTITNMCIKRCIEAVGKLRNLIEKCEESDGDEALTVTNSLKKISILFRCNDLNRANVWELVFVNLSENIEGSPLFSTQALFYCIKCCCFSVIHSFVHIVEKLIDGIDISTDVGTLRNRSHAFINLCKNIITKSYNHSLKKQAFKSISTILMYFSDQAISKHYSNKPEMQILVFKPDSKLSNLLKNFVQ